VPRHEDAWGSVGIPPYILNVGNKWRWVAIFTLLAALSLRKSYWYLLDGKWVGLWSDLDMMAEEKMYCLRIGVLKLEWVYRCCTGHVLTKYWVADADPMITYVICTDRYFAVAFSFWKWIFIYLFLINTTLFVQLVEVNSNSCVRWLCLNIKLIHGKYGKNEGVVNGFL